MGQGAEPANGCIQAVCNTSYTGPTKVAVPPVCSNVAGTASPFTKITCVAANELAVPVASCTVGNPTNVTKCQPTSVDTDMSYGTCDAALANLTGGATPVAANSYTTSSCSKVDASTAGGLSYYPNAADYAQCVSGTTANGVKTLSVAMRAFIASTKRS